MQPIQVERKPGEEKALDKPEPLKIKSRKRKKPSAILTAEQAAEFLNINVKSLYRMVANNEIPFKKVGRKYLFGRKTLIDWANGVE